MAATTKNKCAARKQMGMKNEKDAYIRCIPLKRDIQIERKEVRKE